MKKKFKKLIDWISAPYFKFKERQKLKKRLAELKKRDPFIYK